MNSDHHLQNELNVRDVNKIWEPENFRNTFEPKSNLSLLARKLTVNIFNKRVLYKLFERVSSFKLHT